MTHRGVLAISILLALASLAVGVAAVPSAPSVGEGEADQHSGVTVAGADPVVGHWTTIQVTVPTGADWFDPGGEVVLESDELAVDPDRYPAYQPPFGDGTATFSIHVRPEAAGSQDLTVRVENSAGETVHRETVPVTVRTVDDVVTVDARIEQRDGDRELNMTVENAAGVRVEPAELIVTDAAGGITYRTALYVISAGERTVRDVSLDSSTELPVTVSVYYYVHGEPGTTVERVDEPHGDVDLESVDIRWSEGTGRFSGWVQNTGETDLEYVVVRIQPRDGVDPTIPQWEYTTEDVGAAGTVGFSVASAVDPGVEQVTLVVRYRVDGHWDRRTFTLDTSAVVPEEDEAPSTPRPISTPAGPGAVDDAGGENADADWEPNGDDTPAGDLSDTEAPAASVIGDLRALVRGTIAWVPRPHEWLGIPLAAFVAGVVWLSLIAYLGWDRYVS